MLYSYKGEYPQELPSSFRLENGFTVTSLDKLSTEELNSLGFFGPYVIPSYTPQTQKLIWTGVEFLVENIDIVDQNNLNPNKPFLDPLFIPSFNNTIFHNRIRKESTLSFKINTLYNQLLTCINNNPIDARKFEINIAKILLSVDFSDEEKSSFFGLVKKFKDSQSIFISEIDNLLEDINLPDPEKSYETYESWEYDFETDRMLHSKKGPFKSWVLNNEGIYVPPIEYPSDGKAYKWDEESISWVLIEGFN